jgi:hypothetical protein
MWHAYNRLNSANDGMLGIGLPHPAPLLTPDSFSEFADPLFIFMQYPKCIPTSTRHVLEFSEKSTSTKLVLTHGNTSSPRNLAACKLGVKVNGIPDEVFLAGTISMMAQS